MKKIKVGILLLPIFVYAQNFNDIKTEISNSLKYKMQQNKIKIYEKKLKSIKAKNYGSLDLEYNAVHLFKQPVMKMDFMNTKMEMPASDKNNYTGVIKYSYPLFTGFAITTSISKSEIELIKEKLNLKNVKRELLLNSAEIYSNIYAIKAKIKALKTAKQALLSAKEKAVGFYEAGMLDKSKVDEIDAKYFEIIALIDEAKAQKKSLLNLLSYIVNTKITSIDDIDTSSYTLAPNFENRPDIQAIKQTLKIADKDIKLAKSKYYPQIGIEAGLKREADSAVLDDNDYQNTDKSYVGLGIKYNIFDGGAKDSTLQMAKIAKNTQMIFYRDYLNNVKTEYDNDVNKLNALKIQLQSALKEIKARKSYYDYMKAKFDEGLVDVTDLNDAISQLASSKAKKEAIKAQIFFLNQKLKLNGGYDE